MKHLVSGRSGVICNFCIDEYYQAIHKLQSRDPASKK
jgi:hypothetical protein